MEVDEASANVFQLTQLKTWWITRVHIPSSCLAVWLVGRKCLFFMQTIWDQCLVWKKKPCGAKVFNHFGSIFVLYKVAQGITYVVLWLTAAKLFFFCSPLGDDPSPSLAPGPMVKKHCRKVLISLFYSHN